MAQQLTSSEQRESHVVYVVVRFLTEEGSAFLLLAHPKWGDWGLIGGHVEPHEVHDWKAAACRETEEELPGLKLGVDATLKELPLDQVTWGPVASRSARGIPTVYKTRWYALRFQQSPLRCLSKLPQQQLAFVTKQSVLGAHPSEHITPLLARLDACLPGGLDAVPPAWPHRVDLSASGIERLPWAAPVERLAVP